MKYLNIFVIFLTIYGCKQYRSGVPIRPHQQEEIKSAKTKTDVYKILGSPAATNFVGNEKWFYYTSTGEVFAFLDPKFTKYEILSIEFDDKENIKNLKLKNIAEKEISQSDEKTHLPSQIELNFFQELFGNIGRFNSSGLPTGN